MWAKNGCIRETHEHKLCLLSPLALLKAYLLRRRHGLSQTAVGSRIQSSIGRKGIAFDCKREESVIAEISKRIPIFGAKLDQNNNGPLLPLQLLYLVYVQL